MSTADIYRKITQNVYFIFVHILSYVQRSAKSHKSNKNFLLISQNETLKILYVIVFVWFLKC